MRAIVGNNYMQIFEMETNDAAGYTYYIRFVMMLLLRKLPARCVFNILLFSISMYLRSLSPVRVYDMRILINELKNFIILNLYTNSIFLVSCVPRE